VAHGRSVEEVAQVLGADALIYQDLVDLIEAVQKRGRSHVDRFDCSVFDGDYVTGDVTTGYLEHLEANRNDHAKEARSRHSETVIELHNTV
jgi:amidophosphoribosyltransferase